MCFNLICVTIVIRLSVLPDGRLHTDAFSRSRHPLLALLPRKVGLVEEAGEEHKVGEVHGDGELHVELGYVTGVRGVLPQVIVRPDVHSAAHDHLAELQGGDGHGQLPGGEVAHAAESIVRVHQTVHAVVHHDEPAGRRRVLGVGEPGVEQHGDVVIPVQEDERLPTQHDEHRVTELWQLRQDKHPRPEPAHAILLDETGNRQKQLLALIAMSFWENRSK